MKKEEKIVVCWNCKGFGKKECSEIVDYHKNEYTYWDEVCRTCNGHGRLKQTVTTETSKLSDEELQVNSVNKDGGKQ